MKKLTPMVVFFAVLFSGILAGCNKETGSNWKEDANIKPAAGTYNLQVIADVVGESMEELMGESTMDMEGTLEISGTDSDSKVVMTINSGKMEMKIPEETYDETKSAYEMLYGNEFKFDDKTHTLSGDVPEEIISNFSNEMTYSEFLQMDDAQTYSDGKGNYKVVGDLDGQAMTFIFMKK